MSLKPYPEYKDSGVPCLGEIPAHWQALPNRALFAEVNDRNHPEEPLLSVTIGKGVIRQTDLLADTSKKDSSNENKANYKLVQPRDIAYNKMRAWQGAIGVSHYRGIVSPAYIVVRLRGEQNPEYFHYLLRTPAFAKEAERWSYGITSDQWSLRAEDFKQIYCSLPLKEEQDAIVAFLTHTDRRINHLIRAKRRLIELLNEQKQAIIHRAVARGLVPDVRLKPSGIGWLGDVPKHWEVGQIGHFAKVGNGSTPSRGNAAYWSTNGYPWLNSASVNQGIITKADQFVTDLALRECHLPHVRPGSVLVAITGQGKTRGTAAVLAIEATINQHMAYISPRTMRVSPDYLQMYLTAAYVELRAISNDAGSTKGALTCEDVKHFKVALPPTNEQDRLVCMVRQELANVEATLTRIRREIDLLREYRTRLIADVVTGKLDVRGVGLPMLDEAAALEDWETDEDTEADEMDETEGVAV